MIERFTTLIERFISLVAVRLPDDVLKRLGEMREGEGDPVQKVLYDSYFDNFDKALALGRPCCQDTGLPHFYLRAGTAFPYLAETAGVLKEAVRRATLSVPLRPNAVEFFDDINTGDNTAERIPWIHWDIVPGGSDMEITLYFSGAGCTLPGQARVFKPSDGYRAIVPFVFDVVCGPALNACPPLVVGVGLGHSMENAAALSKKACLRLFGGVHPHPKGAALERELLQGLNGLGIGAQGLPGRRGVMAVHVESSGRHTATIACAVSVSCYVHRRGILRLDSGLSWEMPVYRGAVL